MNRIKYRLIVLLTFTCYLTLGCLQKDDTKKMQNTGNDNSHSAQENPILDQLNQLKIKPNINYEADPKFYDKALISFYRSIVERGISTFNLKETSALNKILWDKLLTNKFIRLDSNSEKSITKEFESDLNYVMDVYFDIANTLYRNRNQVGKNKDKIKEWLIQKSLSKEKPFILMYFAGAQIELKNSNKSGFISCLQYIENFDWKRFQP